MYPCWSWSAYTWMWNKFLLFELQECLHKTLKKCLFYVITAEKRTRRSWRVLTIDTEKCFLCNNSWKKDILESEEHLCLTVKIVFCFNNSWERTCFSWKSFYFFTVRRFLCNNSRKKDIMELEEFLHLRVKSFLLCDNNWEEDILSWKSAYTWEWKLFLMYCNKLTTAENRTC